MKNLLLLALILGIPMAGMAKKKAMKPAVSPQNVSDTARESVPKDGAKLKLVLTGLKNSKGKAKAQLFSSGSAATATAAATQTGIIKNGKSELVFKGLAPGQYVVRAFHDVNSTEKLKLGPVALSADSRGASNDIARGGSAPAFEDALVRYDGGEVILYIPIHY